MRRRRTVEPGTGPHQPLGAAHLGTGLHLSHFCRRYTNVVDPSNGAGLTTVAGSLRPPARGPRRPTCCSFGHMLVQVKGVDFDEGGNEWVMGDSLELQVGSTKHSPGHDR